MNFASLQHSLAELSSAHKALRPVAPLPNDGIASCLSLQILKTGLLSVSWKMRMHLNNSRLGRFSLRLLRWVNFVNTHIQMHKLHSLTCRPLLKRLSHNIDK